MGQYTARVSKNKRALVVTIPLEFRFPEGVKEVFIRKVGDDVVLSPRPADWSDFLASNLRVSDDFIADLEDLSTLEPDHESYLTWQARCALPFPAPGVTALRVMQNEASFGAVHGHGESPRTTVTAPEELCAMRSKIGEITITCRTQKTT